MDTKKALREAMWIRLRGQSPQDRARCSQVIQEKLWRLPVFGKAKSVFFFVSMPEEVDTHPMIDRALAEGKRVAVPQSDLKTKALQFYEIDDRAQDLKPGLLGILEPDSSRMKTVSVKDADCVIVPGVVFGRNRYRLGHGAGFYDRFLAGLDAKTVKIGLAYSFQLVNRVPYEDHDIAVDEIITD